MGIINLFIVIMYSSVVKVIFFFIEDSMVKKEKFVEVFVLVYDVSVVIKLFFFLFVFFEVVRNKFFLEFI